MGLFQKTFLFSCLFHAVVLVFFALFLPSEKIPFSAVPVELVPLPPPPEQPGREAARPLPEPVVEPEPAQVRIYVPEPALPDFEHPVTGLSPGRPEPLAPFPGIEAFDYPLESPPRPARPALVIPGPGTAGLPAGVESGDFGFELAGPGRERRPVHAPLPAYPAWAMERGIEASLELKLWIDDEGRVTEVQVQRSSGWPEIDFPSLHRVREWRFEPGSETLTWAVLPLHFRLR